MSGLAVTNRCRVLAAIEELRAASDAFDAMDRAYQAAEARGLDSSACWDYVEALGLPTESDASDRCWGARRKIHTLARRSRLSVSRDGAVAAMELAVNGYGEGLCPDDYEALSGLTLRYLQAEAPTAEAEAEA